MKVGELVKRKGTIHNLCGIITKVYESRIKTTVEVMWFGDDYYKPSYVTIEPCYLEKLT